MDEAPEEEQFDIAALFGLPSSAMSDIGQTEPPIEEYVADIAVDYEQDVVASSTADELADELPWALPPNTIDLLSPPSVVVPERAMLWRRRTAEHSKCRMLVVQALHHVKAKEYNLALQCIYDTKLYPLTTPSSEWPNDCKMTRDDVRHVADDLLELLPAVCKVLFSVELAAPKPSFGRMKKLAELVHLASPTSNQESAMRYYIDIVRLCLIDGSEEALATAKGIAENRELHNNCDEAIVHRMRGYEGLLQWLCWRRALHESQTSDERQTTCSQHSSAPSLSGMSGITIVRAIDTLCQELATSALGLLSAQTLQLNNMDELSFITATLDILHWQRGRTAGVEHKMVALLDAYLVQYGHASKHLLHVVRLAELFSIDYTLDTFADKHKLLLRDCASLSPSHPLRVSIVRAVWRSMHLDVLPLDASSAMDKTERRALKRHVHLDAFVHILAELLDHVEMVDECNKETWTLVLAMLSCPLLATRRVRHDVLTVRREYWPIIARRCYCPSMPTKCVLRSIKRKCVSLVCEGND